MRVSQFDKAVDDICERDPRISKSAFHFLRETMDYTSEQMKESGAENNHISAVDLLKGFKEYSLDHFGPMAYTVFTEWNLTKCSDIGDMVYGLIEENIFTKQESDSREDFAEIFTFQEAFVQPFLPKKKSK